VIDKELRDLINNLKILEEVTEVNITKQQGSYCKHQETLRDVIETLENLEYCAQDD